MGNTSVMTIDEAGNEPTLVIAKVYVMICPGITVVTFALLATTRSVVPSTRSWRLSTSEVIEEKMVVGWYPVLEARIEKFPGAIGLVVVAVNVYQPFVPVVEL